MGPDPKLAFAERINYCRKTGFRTPKTNLPFQVLAGFTGHNCEMAERQGFEPWERLHAQRFSRPPRSTTPASLRGDLVRSFSGLCAPKQERFSASQEYTGILIALGYRWPKLMSNLTSKDLLMRALLRFPLFAMCLVSLTGFLAFSTSAKAADQTRLEAFLEVTGFDVALDSIRLSADSAPQMLGMQADDFGSEWSRLVGDVFSTGVMHDMALDILGNTLSDDLLTHAADFYASDLGQRLVAVENKSHMVEEDGLKSETGTEIIAGLVRIGSPRVEILNKLNEATDVEDTSIKAIQEVQIRFLMAAAAAGVIELQMEEPDLREAMRNQQDELRTSIKANALASSAYTYQAFSDDEVATYAEVLENPKMQEVYALMNAVQYEIMANRFEAVAERLSRMQPSQDL